MVRKKMLGWIFSKTKKQNCDDGTTREVYKDPADAFPFVAKDWSQNYKAAIHSLEQISGEVGITTKNKVQGVFTELDEVNRSMQFSLRAVYIIYSTDPCNNGDYLKQAVHEILNREDITRRIKMFNDLLKDLAKQGVGEQKIIEAIESFTTMGLKVNQETAKAFKEAKDNIAAYGEGVQQ